jgi:hypothetical protein
MEINEILEDFSSLRRNFTSFRATGDVNKEALIEYEARFVELKCELGPHRKLIAGQWQKYDDKAATGIKFRIAIAIHEGTLKDEDDKLVYPKCSINQAEKYASGSDLYKTFLKNRSMYKEALVNVADLRNDMDSYINLIKDMLKTL